MCKFSKKYGKHGAGEKAQKVRALAVFPEGQGSIHTQ